MRYRLHLINLFGRRIASKGLVESITNMQQANQIRREWELLHPDCHVSIESVTESGKLPLEC